MVPAEDVLALLLVLLICFLIGVAVRTPVGRVMRERIEEALVPGFIIRLTPGLLFPRGPFAVI